MLKAQSDFYYESSTRLKSYIFCLWAFRKRWLRKSKFGRPEYFFKRASDKLRRDLDVRRLLIIVSSYTAVLKAVFSRDQRFLLSL